MKMFKPAHPGLIIKEMVDANQKITISLLAKCLHITRPHLSKIINCHSGVSVEMAIRLSIAFDTSYEFWLNLQRAYDIWEADKKINSLKEEIGILRPRR